MIRKIVWDMKPCYALIFNDLTDKEMVTALTLASQQKDQVIATVSHELRTPLNGIIGLINTVLEKVKDVEVIEYLNHCKSCSNLLLYFVNAILDLSQLRKQKLTIVNIYFNIDEILQEIRALYSFPLRGKNLQFKITKAIDVPTKVYTDKHRLVEVLINLIGNAFKFTFKGFVELIIKIDPKNPDCLRFSVKDTGIGIQDSDLKKLFNMFGKLEQTDKNINTQGAGLGLTISDQLIKALNKPLKSSGITVKSVFGEGSIFSFSIPYQNKNEAKGSDSNSPEASFDLKELYEPTEILTKVTQAPTRSLGKCVGFMKCSVQNSGETNSTVTPSAKKLFQSPNNNPVTNNGRKILVVDDNPFNHLAIAHTIQKKALE